MKELETLKLFRGATSVIELDFTGFNFEDNSYCQLTIKKKYNEDIIFQHDFNKSIKYYVTFKDEFTVSLDDDKYKYDIMYMLNDERYPQCSISDVIVDEVVNDYVGEFDKNAVQVTEVLAEGVEITQSIKATTSNVIVGSGILQEKNVISSINKQVVLPDNGYDGLSSVTIEPVLLESKSVVPTKEVQILNPSENFVGFSQVTIDPIPDEYIIPTGNLDIRTNGDYDVTENASVNVKVEPKLQDKEARVTAPVNTFIHPDEGYDGLGYVNVIATVDTETKEVTPTKEVQTINPSDGKYISSVTVNAIPDNYIEPSGEMEITENGSYDVIDKASVKVETSGADLSEYFNYNPSEVTSGNGAQGWLINNFVLKLPDITLSQENSDCTAMFREWNLPIMPRITNTEYIKICTYMFCGAKTKNYDFSEWNTKNITSMNYMFNGSSLEVLDLSKWDLSSLTSALYIFNNCLAKVILAPNLITEGRHSNITFSGCTNLETIDISNWDTSNLTSLSEMFYNCSKLTELDLSHFNTNKVTNFRYAFRNCKVLMKLDIRNFDFSNSTSNSGVFDGMPADCEIIVKDDIAKAWVLDKRSDFTNVKTVAELGV